MLLRLILLLFAAAQSKPATVEGSVTNSVSGQPVKRASVALRDLHGNEAYRAVTSSAGKFHFDSVEPGRYVASAQADGYSTVYKTARTQRLFVAAAEQAVTGIHIDVAPLGVISGQITDDAGEPIPRMGVIVFRSHNGRASIAGLISTDDRGRYRLIDLERGSYYLLVTRAGEANPNVHYSGPIYAYPRVFYPGVRTANEAELISIQPGAEVTANLRLRKMAAYRIRGKVAGFAGGQLTIGVQPCGEETFGGNLQASAGVAQDGSFEISRVPVGQYCWIFSTGSGPLEGSAVAVEDADLSGVGAQMPPRFLGRGVLALDGLPTAAHPSVTAGLFTKSGRPLAAGRADSDGKFAFAPSQPAVTCRVLIQPDLRFYVKSIRYGTQDISSGWIPMLQRDTPLTVTLGSDPGEIAGIAATGAEEAGAPVAVIAYPKDDPEARGDLVRLVEANPDGTFALGGLAPGDYSVIAAETGDTEELRDPRLLRLLASYASTLAVQAKGHAAVSPKVVTFAEVERAREQMK